MKKTLIAMAVLAASGASFAQATITGNVIAGWKQSTSAAGADASGLGFDTAEFYLNASEDLGGGLTAKAKLGLSKVDRGNSGAGTASGAANNGLDSFATGGDTVISLGGGFGTVAISQTRGADYLTSSASSALGGVGIGMDGKVLSSRTVRDALGYTLPTFVTGLTLAVSYNEPTSINGIGAGAAGSTAGLSTANRYIGYSARYNAGPLKVDGAYFIYEQTGTVTTTATNDNTAIRLSGAYDLGMLSLGLGTQVNRQTDGTRTDMQFAVAVPLGKTTLGANWVQRKFDGYTSAGSSPAQAQGSYSGYGVSAQYDLSKRTALIAKYGRWDTAVVTANTSSETQLWVSHSF
jgi:Gram-negative porin